MSAASGMCGSSCGLAIARCAFDRQPRSLQPPQPSTLIQVEPLRSPRRGPAEHHRGEADGQAARDVEEGEAALALLGQALALDHPGRERREGAEQRGAREQEPVARGAGAVQQTEQEGAEPVDDEDPEREPARPAALNRDIEKEAQARTRAAHERDRHPQEQAARQDARPLRSSARTAAGRRGARPRCCRGRTHRPVRRVRRGRARRSRAAAWRTSSAHRTARCRATGRGSPRPPTAAAPRPATTRAAPSRRR